MTTKRFNRRSFLKTRATNAPDAEQFIRRDHRKGWKLI